MDFHYAPDPCGLPCTGGPISAEERREWARLHDLNCPCLKKAAG